MSGGARGAARERKVAAEQRDDGWIVKGTGDAHGEIDQIHLKAGHVPRVVQVKGSSVKRGRFADFPPEDRAKLLDAAEAAGAEAWLAWAPPDRKPTRWIPPIEWPGIETEHLRLLKAIEDSLAAIAAGPIPGETARL